ncbi:MAG: DUF92 domain-containing protein [Myxococcales bacterium]
MLLTRLALGLCCSALIGGFALRRGSLSKSGAVAALGIGTSIYVGGGGGWFSALVTFFVTSTLLAKVGKARKATIKLEFEKGDTRDALQALSNGGAAALCALGMALQPHPAFAAGFVAALATANGDTWATELGVLSRAEPISLLQLRRVPRGTSGAVSPLGLLATFLGGAVIGGVAALNAQAFGVSVAWLVGLGSLGGVLGSLVDSVLGASLQSGFHCDTCARDAEGSTHRCGRPTRHVRGFRWFNNDVVNLAATSIAALVAGITVWSCT